MNLRWNELRVTAGAPTRLRCFEVDPEFGTSGLIGAGPAPSW